MTRSAPRSAPGPAPRPARLPNGLARAALRFRPAGFVGTFVALAMAALVVAACGILLETGVRASVPPERYAHAPVVVAADQRAHLVSGHGEDREDETTQVPDRARLDSSLVAKAASVPGARTAIADVTFPVQADAREAGTAHETDTGHKTGTAHGWGSTVFTGEKVVAGRAPGPGEVVLSDAGGRTVGDRVTLTTADGPHTFRLSGTTAPQPTPTVWFADAEAVRLSAYPGRVDAIAVLPKDGVRAETLKSQGPAPP